MLGVCVVFMCVCAHTCVHVRVCVVSRCVAFACVLYAFCAHVLTFACCIHLCILCMHLCGIPQSSVYDAYHSNMIFSHLP